jgi:zinc/manganese transport system substrate-binding protein
MPRRLRLLALPLLLASLQPAHAAPVSVVAAENFYGDVATQIGGDTIHVVSILSNPDQDPHLFEASPSTARALSGARIVIVNGVDYDPWMTKLLSATRAQERTVINVADLVHRKSGDNPHLWYDVATVKAFAAQFERVLASADPAHKADYTSRLATFNGSLDALGAKIDGMRAKYAGTPVTATEPVFGYMADAIGLDMRNKEFQIAVMNDTEPSISDVAAFEADLKQKKVKALIYNAQVTEPASQRLLAIAKAGHVPTVGVTETEPAGTTYQAWMLAELEALDRALSGMSQ